MLAWLMDNYLTLIICAVLVLLVTGAVWVLVRDRKKGKSSCGGSCGSCPMSGSCHNH